MLKFKTILVLSMIVFFYPLTTASFAEKGTSRIKGGMEAPVDLSLGVVALVNAGQNAYFGQFGAGALIHPQWVVTSARNVFRADTNTRRYSEDIEVISGESDLLALPIDRARVKRILVHPDFDNTTGNADIALLELASPLQQPVLMRSPSTSEIVDKTATVLGWGLADLDNFPNMLQKVDLPVVSRETAESIYLDTLLTETMMFAGYPDSTAGPCDYDTGAPLVLRENGTQLLAGIFSWNNGCNATGDYGVYTDITKVKDFIDTHVPVRKTKKLLPLTISGFGFDTIITVQNTGDISTGGMLIPKDASGAMVSAYKPFSLEPGASSEFTVGGDFSEPETIKYMTMDSTSPGLEVHIKYTLNGASTAEVKAPSGAGTEDIIIDGIMAGENQWNLIFLVNASTLTRQAEFTFNTGETATLSLAPGKDTLFSIRTLFNGSARPDISSATISNAENVAGILLGGNAGTAFEDIVLMTFDGNTLNN